MSVTKYPPMNIVTNAGTIILSRSDLPLLEVVRTPTGEGIIRNFREIEAVYKISLRDAETGEEKPIGGSTVLYRTFGFLEKDNPGAFKLLKDFGFKDGDVIARINTFYPLIEAPELKHKGIGTAILAELIKGLEAEGAAAVLAFTIHNEARGLLIKSGFRSIESWGTHQKFFYLKKLSEEPNESGSS